MVPDAAREGRGNPAACEVELGIANLRFSRINCGLGGMLLRGARVKFLTRDRMCIEQLLSAVALLY